MAVVETFTRYVQVFDMQKGLPNGQMLDEQHRLHRFICALYGSTKFGKPSDKRQLILLTGIKVIFVCLFACLLVWVISLVCLFFALLFVFVCLCKNGHTKALPLLYIPVFHPSTHAGNMYEHLDRSKTKHCFFDSYTR